MKPHLLAPSFLLALSAWALPAQAVGRLADVTVTDRNTGATLPLYYHRGDYWVAGQYGAKYAIAVRNKLGERVLAVTAVDGVNVLSGETAAWDQAGYVFSPWQQYQVTGWRKSSSEVAAFEFSALGDSYAGRTGRPANVGVIGVALFRERLPEPVAQAPAYSSSSRSEREAAAAPATGIARCRQVRAGRSHRRRHRSVRLRRRFREEAAARPATGPKAGHRPRRPRELGGLAHQFRAPAKPARRGDPHPLRQPREPGRRRRDPRAGGARPHPRSLPAIGRYAVCPRSSIAPLLKKRRRRAVIIWRMPSAPTSDDAAEDSDESLMLRFAAGDIAAFDALYARHELGVWRYVFRSVRVQAVADDLLQDVWFAVARSAPTYTVSARFKTWLFTMAHNRLIDYFRTARHHVSIDGSDDEDSPGMGDTLAADSGFGPCAGWSPASRPRR
jgi:hypothetical protein